jgi:leucyl-tRNA synthetase
MDYNFSKIEPKWQKYWCKNKTFKAEIDHSKPKFYVLDMFPYPSGAGLHVGHPLGYIASDIYARYMRQRGYNVLHPMGYDAYGLPAEQYAIQTGTHPEITTNKNINRYREQLDKIGFSFDWDREIRTCDPKYYKWTQWTFIQLFNSWYNKKTKKSEPIDQLIKEFEQNGNVSVNASTDLTDSFTAENWNAMDEKNQQETLMSYRLAYLSDTMVNWCPELGTVLANDEVKEGLSERGGHPIERKLMKQWSLRITAYAQRLLDGLEKIDWSDSLKEVQKNWIGRSEGATCYFDIKGFKDKLEIFTTRPDTMFGSTYMVLAPEHNIVEKITTSDQKEEIDKYVAWAKNRSERERQSEVKNITGVFTGSYGINPLNGAEIPIWIADYVLAGYGSGAIMAVPAHDSRDYAFAKHFNLPIIQVVSGGDISEESYDAKEGKMINSGFLNGMDVKEAIIAAIKKIEEMKIGFRTINYRLRDAIFSRQRYWGEPFPVYYKDGIPYTLSEDKLPLLLPEVDKYLPTETGEPPLARAKNWTTEEGYPLETNTMPGFAGSSAYYLRYMDPHNDKEYFSKEANEYWKDVDLYIGGDEHAAGHLIYSRFWNNFLFDIGLTSEEEPFKKLINQGKIQGRSSFVYRVNHEKYAEYLLWEYIKEMGGEKSFIRDYRDGHRKFDFYNKEANLIIEIKSQLKLEKLESYYKEYIKTTDKKLLLLPIADIFEIDEELMNATKKAIEDTQKGVIFNHHEIRPLKPMYVSKNVKDRELFSTPLHVDINLVKNDILDIESFKHWRAEFADAEFILEDGKYHCGYEVEKMSKSKHNVQNPDALIEKYGADTLRLYEMFLGPLENHKPWNTKGIEGVFRFIKKLWKLYFDTDGKLNISDEEPTKEELKVLHKTIKKVADDIERFSFNTTVSSFMICVNELTDLKCNKQSILADLSKLISPYAPHLAEELWSILGNTETISYQPFPEFKEEYIKENSYSYPVSFNGKMRFKIDLPIDMPKDEIEKAVLNAEEAQRWIEGKTIQKIIVIPNKIVNVVV